MSIGDVILKLDGESAKYMYTHAPPFRIVFDEVAKVGRKCGDFTQALEQFFLLVPLERSEEIENFNGNEQTRVAHFLSPEIPSSPSHCSAVSHRSGEWSLILCANFAA